VGGVALIFVMTKKNAMGISLSKPVKSCFISSKIDRTKQSCWHFLDRWFTIAVNDAFLTLYFSRLQLAYLERSD
jgi:hypothetical protein